MSRPVKPRSASRVASRGTGTTRRVARKKTGSAASPRIPPRKPRDGSAPPRRRASDAGIALAPADREPLLLDPADALPPTEEERIESSKYTPAPKRVFEDERFVFPESYGVNRLRLLVKDPQWLFAYWDIDPAVLGQWRRELGERTMALSRLTLRVFDPGKGDDTLILLPTGSRSWYLRAEVAPRAYGAELGLTLPSGEFRRVATSNVVETPRTGPSPLVATRKVPYTLIASSLFAPPVPAGPSSEEARSGAASSDTLEGRRPTRKGGASDVFRR